MAGSASSTEHEPVDVSVRNIGGISESTVSLEDGVNILTGRNATNRTSLLRALMLALGSNKGSLKGNTDSGKIELSIDGETYTRTLERINGSVTLGGEPYLDDPEVADLFAFLLEQNPSRRSVARGDDLRELIMRPVDTDEIQSAINRLERERDTIDERLDELDRKDQRLTELEQRRTELNQEVEQTQTDLEQLKSETDALDAGIEDPEDERAVLESKLEDLQEMRSEIGRVNQAIQTEQESIRSLKDEQEDVQSELTDVEVGPDATPDQLNDEINRLRERKRTINGLVSEIQHIIQFNQEMIAEDNADLRNAFDDETSEGGTITDQLVKSTTKCWTCGSTVDRSQIESTLDRLREFREEKLETVRTIDEQLTELTSRHREIEDQREKRERLESRVESIEDEIENRKRRLEDLQAERETLDTRLNELEEEVESLENDEFSDILDNHRKVNRQEFKLERLQEDLKGVESEISTIESALQDRAELLSEREAVTDQLVDYRTKIDQIESQAVERFNEHMESILRLLKYDNLARIWIERVNDDGSNRHTDDATVFKLHIVRRNDEGKAYEDTVEHLSESEREVTGLVFALAGYLVHEVHETVPFMLLDSLEAIDSNRIATLVEYFSEYADHLIVALLPEDEQSLDSTYHRVTEI